MCFILITQLEFTGEVRSGIREEIENVSANQRPGRPCCFFDQPEATNLVEDVEFLLPVKFRQMLFSGLKEVENILAN